MKTNRQKAGMNPQTFTQHIARRQRSQLPVTETITLDSLFKQGVQGQVATLTCKEQIAVVLQPKLASLNKSRKHKNVYLRGGVSNALKKCFSNWQTQPQQCYIFSPIQPPQSVRSFRTSESDLGKILLLNKNSSDKPFNFLSPRQPSLSHNESTPVLNDHKPLGRLFSQRNLINQQEEKHNMFVVQEVGESIQSDPKSSFNQQKQNRDVRNLAHLNFYSSKDTQQYLQQIQLQQPQNNPVELDCEQKMHKTKQNQPCWSLQKRKEPSSPPKQQPDTSQQAKQSAGESRFSFTTHMRQGLLKNNQQSLQPEASLKIIGDDSIEKEKKQLREESIGSQICQMSQLSSIVSNVRDQGFRKEAEQNSLKHDLEDINKYCSRGSIQKLNLHALAEQRENFFDDRIQVTSKAENLSEYTVRYDVRFVKRTTMQPTQVVRLSPLRFRKTTQTTQQQVPPTSAQHCINA